MGEYYDELRPTEVTVKSVRGDDVLKYGELFTVGFQLDRRGTTSAPDVEIVASAASFVTHSLSMHQRMLRLECVTVEVTVEGPLMALVRVPTSPVTAPTGYYMLTVLSGGIPSKSKWVRFVH
ncbi:hypothetical protein HPP92_009734 [Vanilla planifolia]|nr:hypothetical protein HPP92_009734 [Vanilla planifolia]